jgi:hypothetical protein
MGDREETHRRPSLDPGPVPSIRRLPLPSPLPSPFPYRSMSSTWANTYMIHPRQHDRWRCMALAQVSSLPRPSPPRPPARGPRSYNGTCRFQCSCISGRQGGISILGRQKACRHRARLDAEPGTSFHPRSRRPVERPPTAQSVDWQRPCRRLAGPWEVPFCHLTMPTLGPHIQHARSAFYPARPPRRRRH